MTEIIKTAYEEVFSFKKITAIVIISLAYLTFTMSLLNYRYVLNSVWGDYPITYKVGIYPLLLEGVFTALSKTDAVLLITTSILIGINLILLLTTLDKLKDQKTKFFVGGGSVLGLVSTGCASCGLSVLSVLGIGTSFFNFLPFGSKMLYFFSLGALIFSIVYMTKKLTDGNICKVKRG